ncbi:hypothetical protein COCC4DRAFT_26207 [Bipolaris maydis ATCC 48331]|uniref:Carboxylesterase type B domain-containing protein n=2 Tax=Cochliobolus heterostrophus TaxID=5016 RepID=M2SL02_COCH5|nr:uncharacterized protein COCC4DRAFT_26207 [Bipolaris maydis ATCC 48331]EMD85995.1 hypothetical protein COCHEDRAFT_1035064 [Bipolaris maydis C5]KAJ5028225.1 hypothetical protein J3E73DRAFT_256134 [Bipolaris maydis]ENI01999.1 hypothetical protein COCC4DRAFT_26207 [Bipolaris maydis ATCC 48331]KAJ6203970.1 hypothetical protein PSV09DRAFT_1035064 [Bipolaris maydis]KAJ6265509.1 hypothetical protein PSV08DRAFT_375181 [Bipolaris maydis]
MFGTNLNEAPIFLAVIGSNDATAAFNSIVEQVNTSSTDAPDAHTAVTDTYAEQGITVFDKLLDRVLTDAVYTCTTARLSNFLDRNSYTTYRYMYSGVFPSASIFKDAGAYHTSEVPQVFGTWERSNRSGNATEQQIKLSSFMQKTWANFAKDSEKGVGWAKAGSTLLGRELGVLGEGDSAGVTVKRKAMVDYACALYDTITYFFGFDVVRGCAGVIGLGIGTERRYSASL